MPKICPNCGKPNDLDAEYCDKCGESLRAPRRPYRQPPQKEGMTNTTKLLIVACVVLVAGLGLTVGLLWSGGAIAAPNNSVSVSQSGEKVTYQATWHEVSSFSGSAGDYRSFQTKGQRFKVVMSATPFVNYNTNSLSVDVSGNNGLLSSGSLNWGPNDALTVKEKTIEVTGPPGTYWISVYALDLENWNVKVLDYY